MPDARCTRGPVCKKEEEDAHEHTGSAEAIRHSLRNGFTAYVALSPAIGLFDTVVSRIWLSGPGWDDRPPGDLTPTIEASGPHDFAVRSNPSSPTGFAGQGPSLPEGFAGQGAVRQRAV